MNIKKDMIIVTLVQLFSWIIYQKRNFLLNLNGLEYFIFAFLLGIIPVLVIIINNIVISIYNKIKINKKIYKTNKGEIDNG